MRTPPVYATGLLLRLGPHDESFIGDLVEEYASGRSRAWYWRQVLSAIVLSAFRQIGAQPIRTLVTLVAGFTTLLAFFTLGDRIAGGLAGWLWNWDRHTAYATGVWWPFAICAAFVSYSGFALSALVVVRLNRRNPAPMLIAYAFSVFATLVASALVIEFLTWRQGAVPVPHTLFYLVSITLPHHWRTGLLLAPSIILIVGAIACPSRGRDEPYAGQGATSSNAT
jgi:hypothetical protein